MDMLNQETDPEMKEQLNQNQRTLSKFTSNAVS